MCKIVYQVPNTYGKLYTKVKHCRIEILPKVKGDLIRNGGIITRITYTPELNF